MSQHSMSEKRVYYAILAGGSGERLWPLSRRANPKQLLPFLHNQSLLEHTVARLTPLADPHELIVVTTAAYEQRIAHMLSGTVGTLIAEPVSRNTAASLALLALLLQAQDPTACVVVVPADHYIPATDIFVNFLQHALDYVQHHEAITVLGIKPTYPETKYGYIEHTVSPLPASYPAPVVGFYEKPLLEQARRYIENPAMLWHTGIFCAPVSLLVKEIKQHAPDVFNAVHDYIVGIGRYEDVPMVSFDVAVLEKSTSLTVLPVNFAWCDVGNLVSYLSVQNMQQDPAHNEVIALDATRNLVNAENKLIVLIGVHDLCIVETEDVLLVAQKDQADKVKQVLDVLRAQADKEYL